MRASLLADGELERLKRSKVKEPQNPCAGRASPLPASRTPIFLNLLTARARRFRDSDRATLEYTREVDDDGNRRSCGCSRSSAARERGLLRGQLLGAPKEYDLLQSINQGVEKTLDLGSFLTPIAVFFLKALRWIYGVVGNYGVAIILLTLGIRIVLFPLMHTSTVSMRKMARRFSPRSRRSRPSTRRRRATHRPGPR